MKNLITALLFLIVINHLDATPQIPDYLIYNGKTIPIFSNPLESYLEQNNFQAIDRGCNSSSCNRGYIATWELKNDSLFLVEIKRCGIMASAGVYTGLECDETKLSEVLSFLEKKFQSRETFAYWYSGELISPQGRLIEYIHGGYLSKYERELHLIFKEGIFTESKVFSNDVKPKLFDEYNYRLIVDTVFANIAKLDWKYLEGELLCADSYLITINKKGKITKVKNEPLLDTKWQNFWDNFHNSACRRNLYKSIQHLRFNKHLKGERKRISVKINLHYDNEELRLE